MAWLDDHPPVRDQFRCPRRATPSGVVVVHTAEGGGDTSPPDTGAESVANFIRARDTPGSYHDLVDSNSIINLVRYECEAYQDATGSNSHGYGVSAAAFASRWPVMPSAWTTAVVRNMARAAANYAVWIKARHGVTIPARRITKAQSDSRVPGFISHAERDPARRTDPGAAFPWSVFLSEYRRALGDDMALDADDKKWLQNLIWGTSPVTKDGLPGGVWVHKFDMDGDGVGDTPAYRALGPWIAPDIAEAVVAALPSGSADAALVEAVVRKVFADAGTP